MTPEKADTDFSKEEAEYNATIHGLIQRLVRVVEYELEALDLGKQELLQESANKKMRLLSQLENIGAHDLENKISPINKSAIKKLKETLSINMQKLELKIKAINDLSKAIENAVREDESDGTYAAGSFSRGF